MNALPRLQVVGEYPRRNSMCWHLVLYAACAMYKKIPIVQRCLQIHRGQKLPVVNGAGGPGAGVGGQVDLPSSRLRPTSRGDKPWRTTWKWRRMLCEGTSTRTPLHLPHHGLRPDTNHLHSPPIPARFHSPPTHSRSPPAARSRLAELEALQAARLAGSGSDSDPDTASLPDSEQPSPRPLPLDLAAADAARAAGPPAPARIRLALGPKPAAGGPAGGGEQLEGLALRVVELEVSCRARARADLASLRRQIRDGVFGTGRRWRP
jgi:hypothetical protein